MTSVDQSALSLSLNDKFSRATITIVNDAII